MTSGKETPSSIQAQKALVEAENTSIQLRKVNYPLNFHDPKFKSDQEVALAWLEGIEKEFFHYGIKSDSDKVGACVRNLTSFVKDAADGREPFVLYAAFIAWFREIMDLPEKRRDIQYELNLTVQTGAFRHYARAFRSIEERNKRCQFVTDDATIKMRFLENLRNRHLKLVLSPAAMSFLLRQLIANGNDAIRLGQVRDYGDPDVGPLLGPLETKSLNNRGNQRNGSFQNDRKRKNYERDDENSSRGSGNHNYGNRRSGNKRDFPPRKYDLHKLARLDVQNSDDDTEEGAPLKG